jgi:hypothetical protein
MSNRLALNDYTPTFQGLLQHLNACLKSPLRPPDDSPQHCEMVRVRDSIKGYLDRADGRPISAAPNSLKHRLLEELRKLTERVLHEFESN